MESARNQSLATPTTLNLGSGKDFRDDCLNLDVDDSWAPDAVCDLSRADLARGVRLGTARFGEIVLRPGSFDAIIANDVLEHVSDLMAMMTTCLSLLRLGGVFHISVPYDLSYGAWQDPTHVRAFNERSWLYYTDWFWYMGWSENRFELQTFDFVPSPIGLALKDQNVPRDEILRTPRAVDSMSVALKKVALTPDDRIVWDHWRERRLAARDRQRGKSTAAVLRPAIVPVAAKSDHTVTRAFSGDFASQRDRFAIWIVSPENYTHHHAFDDIALGLSEAFATLGGSAPVIRDPSQRQGRTLIVLGAQLAPNDPTLLDDCVLFNLEQADATSPWMNGPYLDLLRRSAVLDYSIRNHQALSAYGVAHARVLPIGFAPGLMRVPAAQEKDIDILFYGSLNERREAVLKELERRGAKVVHLFDVYGDVRDEAIARSKIVLNLHFYDTAIFEIARVSLLLANTVCVVTEGTPSDPDIAPLIDGLAVVPYAGLVDRCMSLLGDKAARDKLAADGLAAFMRRPQSDLLEAMFDA